MEAKKKARELVDKMSDNCYNSQTLIHINKKNAKQCALICVDEILNVTIKTSKEECLIFIKYWNKVKQEIFNL